MFIKRTSLLQFVLSITIGLTPCASAMEEGAGRNQLPPLRSAGLFCPVAGGALAGVGTLIAGSLYAHKNCSKPGKNKGWLRNVLNKYETKLKWTAGLCFAGSAAFFGRALVTAGKFSSGFGSENDSANGLQEGGANGSPTENRDQQLGGALLDGQVLMLEQGVAPRQEALLHQARAGEVASDRLEMLMDLQAEQVVEGGPNNWFAILSEHCVGWTPTEIAQCINGATEQTLRGELITFFVHRLNQDLRNKTDEQKKVALEQARFGFDEATKAQLAAEYTRQKYGQLALMFECGDVCFRDIRSLVSPQCLRDETRHALFFPETMDEMRDSEYVKSIEYDHDQNLLSPDGRLELKKVSNTAKIWDVGSGVCVHTLTGHTDWVSPVVWSPDGKHALTGSWDNTAKIWDVGSGVCVHTLTGHTNWVNSVAWSPDGKHALTGSGDKTAKIWDVGSGVCVHTLTGHAGWVNSVAWSPDGKCIFTDRVKWDVARFVKDSQARVQALNVEQLMLLNHLDQLIEAGVTVVPESLRAAFQTLPPDIQSKLAEKIRLA